VYTIILVLSEACALDFLRFGADQHLHYG
jgi:hypothetical protein